MVIPPLPPMPYATGSSRVMIVGLALVPVIVVILASVPAIVLMPFIPKGWTHIDAYIARMIAWTVAILSQSRASSR
jgi:hypothetical protein